MIHFKNRRINLLVTPNHRMFIFNTSKKHRKLLVESAQKSSQRSIFFMPEVRWFGKEEEQFDISGYGKVNTKDLMYILGIFIGDGFVAYQEKQIKTKTGLPREEYLKKSNEEITGRFKEIEKCGNHISISHGYRIFFDIPENDRCRKKVEAALSRLGIKYHCHKGKAGTHLYFTSKIFIKIFTQCGHGAHNKHIPPWALGYSSKYLKYLWDGLMDSDVSQGIIYHTVSEKLVSDICELGIKLNFKPNIHKRHSISFLSGRKIEGNAYCISFGKSSKSISRHRIKTVEYSGDVWCLKLKENKNFIVEREGKLDFCGNTDEVYGDIERGSFTEDSPIKPNSPYAASKAAADLLIKAYVRTYSFPAIIIRPCNNYGPWQYPEKLIPVIINRALQNQKVPVYAKGLNVREWLYVSDCAEAILLLLKKAKTGEVYNVGSGHRQKNIDVVKQILKILDKPVTQIEFVKDRLGHDWRYALDSSKVRKLGWKPKTSFSSGLENTVTWNISNRKWLMGKTK
ncbi:MAG: GDP-mannose 4,6-dehydratase [Candidatus Omnitrophota bacterium]